MGSSREIEAVQPSERLFSGQRTTKRPVIRYPDCMDHLEVLRDKVGKLRQEIAEIQSLNAEFRLTRASGADAQVAHSQRNERLQAIQFELVRLSDLGRRVISSEQMKEKHRSRLELVKQKQAS